VNQHLTTMAAGQSNPFSVTLRHALYVTLTLVGSWVLAAPAVYLAQGINGLAAAGAAVLVCTFAAIAAAVVAGIAMRQGNPLASTLLPMGIRMALPLVVCLIVEYGDRSPLAEHGLSLYIVGFYLIALAVDTWLTVGRIQSPPTSSKEL
jgi:hypothetical protein